MSNKYSPVFLMPHPQHFSDYGFDPQIDYFQVLEEAIKHKRCHKESSIDSFHFKLQKPISNDEYSKKSQKGKKKKKKKRWWENALFFFKWKWVIKSHNNHHHQDYSSHEDVLHARARAFRASISGPVYLADTTGSGSSSRTSSRPSSGPLSGSARKGEVEEEIPYLSLRYLTMEQQQKQRLSTSSIPIYSVT